MYPLVTEDFLQRPTHPLDLLLESLRVLPLPPFPQLREDLLVLSLEFLGHLPGLQEVLLSQLVHSELVTPRLQLYLLHTGQNTASHRVIILLIST